MTKKKPRRFSAARKIEVAVDLIKGASLEEMSRKVGRPAHELSDWKKTFMQYGSLGFKSSSTSSEDLSRAKERELKAKIGDLVMKTELLEEKIDRLEGEKGPLVFRRS
jgi:transposase-like protein